jgi:hypothetical protein
VITFAQNNHQVKTAGCLIIAILSLSVLSCGDKRGSSAPPRSSVQFTTTTFDMWQTFDFDTLSVANLDANDHSNEGAWVVDNDGEASMSASGERAAPAAFNGQQDPGGYGPKYEYLSGNLPHQSGCIGYYFASNKNVFTAGFWLYVPDEVGVYGEHDVFTINPFNAPEGTYIKLGDTWPGTDMRLRVFQPFNGG